MLCDQFGVSIETPSHRWASHITPSSDRIGVDDPIRCDGLQQRTRWFPPTRSFPLKTPEPGRGESTTCQRLVPAGRQEAAEEARWESVGTLARGMVKLGTATLMADFDYEPHVGHAGSHHSSLQRSRFPTESPLPQSTMGCSDQCVRARLRRTWYRLKTSGDSI